MHNYDLIGADSYPSTTGVDIQPSEQTIKVILGFARSYQTVEVEGMQIEVYLN